jgi:hypothetical protein
MRWFAIPLAVALLAGSVARTWAADPAANLKKLDGRYFVAHRAFTPSKTTDPVGNLLTSLGSEVEIKDGKLSAADPKKRGTYLLVTFYSSGKPLAVDLKRPDQKNKVLLGVYSLEGDVLAINVATGEKRPKSVRNTEGEVLLILKRAPKNAAAPRGQTPQ